MSTVITICDENLGHSVGTGNSRTSKTSCVVLIVGCCLLWMEQETLFSKSLWKIHPTNKIIITIQWTVFLRWKQSEVQWIATLAVCAIPVSTRHRCHLWKGTWINSIFSEPSKACLARPLKVVFGSLRCTFWGTIRIDQHRSLSLKWIERNVGKWRKTQKKSYTWFEYNKVGSTRGGALGFGGL